MKLGTRSVLYDGGCDLNHNCAANNHDVLREPRQLVCFEFRRQGNFGSDER